MASLKGPGNAQSHDGSSLRIAIVHARWNNLVVDRLVGGARKSLLASGVKEENIVIQSVPGSWELPLAVHRIYSASQVQGSTLGAGDLLLGGVGGGGGSSSTDLATPASAPQCGPFDAIIAIGVLIKGDTMHFEYIADSVAHGLMRVQLDCGVPVVFGVLTVLSEEQAVMRAGGYEDEDGGENHGEQWGRAAVEMGGKRRKWAGGVFA
ncbi:MAG: hypothetical protein M1839_005577 [Geoglossum umbratile]|nr:MAG: hypothetical protein M1839_005577 [Geoglossum umbratile]